MKFLKVLLTAIAFGVASVSLAQAQEKKGQMGPEQQIERIEQAVGTLTTEQKAKITEIIEKGQEELRALPKEERKGKGQEMMRAQRAKIRELLTPEQQKKYDEMPQGRGGKKKEN